MRILTSIALCLIGSSSLLLADNTRHPPAITAADLAQIKGISWTKGRLPNHPDHWLDSGQLILVDQDGNETELAMRLYFRYDDGRYVDTGELRYPMDHLLLTVQPQELGLKVSHVLTRNVMTIHGTDMVTDLKGYSVVMTRHFRGKTGDTTSDYSFVVEEGDNKLFVLKNSDDKIKTLILRCKRAPSSE